MSLLDRDAIKPGKIGGSKPAERRPTAEDAAAFARRTGSLSVIKASDIPDNGESPQNKAELGIQAAAGVPDRPKQEDVDACVADGNSNDKDGRTWNRFLWCQRHDSYGDITNAQTGQVVGTVNITYIAIAYGNNTDRNVKLFLRGEDVDTTGTFRGGGSARMGPVCHMVISGCEVVGGQVDRPLSQWGEDSSGPTEWFSWIIRSNEGDSVNTLPDKMARFFWKLAGQAVDSQGNVTFGGAGQLHMLRCDSATYFRNRPKACIFDDVDPFFQYSLIGDGVDGVAAHIKKAQDHPEQTYPNYGIPKSIPGKYNGSSGALHRIPTTGTDDETADYRANRAQSGAACRRQAPYANTGLPEIDTEVQECDEYPMAMTAEGAGKGDANFSVEAVPSGENSRAGGLLNGSTGYVWRDRILYRDRDHGFYINIVNCGSCGGGGAPPGPGAPPFPMDPAAKGRLSGSFIQPDLVDRWSNSQLSDEFSMMKSQHMSQLVLQWSANSHDKRERGAQTAVFPTSQPGYRQITNTDVVGRTLSTADATDVGVWVGLQVNDDWWKVYAGDPAWLDREADTALAFARELATRYGGHSAFRGWYLSFELDNVHFSSDIAQQRMISFYRKVTEGLKTMPGGPRPTLIAPFFNAVNNRLPGWQDEGEYADTWQRILEQVHIDVLALQDGVGAGHGTPATIEPWFAAMRNAIMLARARTVLIADTETFKIGASGLQPMPVNEIVSSMKAVKGHVAAYWSFSYNHYQSPRSPFGTDVYQRAYQNWLQQDAVRTSGLDGDRPSRPTNLTAVVNDPQTITLSWGASTDGQSGVAGYHIYRNGELVADKLSSASGFVDRQLDGSSVNVYQVKAFDGSGQVSDASNAASGTTPALPSSPVNHARCGAADGQSGCTYTTDVPADVLYEDIGRSLTDGKFGQPLYSDAWQGRNAVGSYSFVVNLGSRKDITEINTNWFQVREDYAFLPPNVKYHVSDDGVNFRQVSSIDIPAVSARMQTKRYRAINLANVSGQYVKIEVDSGTAWTLIDEVEIRGQS